MLTKVSPCPLLALGLLLFSVASPGAQAQHALTQGTPARGSLTAPAHRPRRDGTVVNTNTSGVIDHYGVDAANKLLWINQGTNAAPTSGQANSYTLFGYDLNGNMTSRERKYAAPYSGLTRHYTFGWDGDDRLRLAQESGSTRLQANYDGDGVRVYKADTWTSAHTYT